MEYCGIDLHQEYSEVCILDEQGEVVERTRVRTTCQALTKLFGSRERMRVVVEACGTSPWVSRLVEGCGHETIVCSPRRVRMIAESTMKNDEVDAEVLARLGRIDPGFLGSVSHRSERAQVLRSKMKVRSSLVSARTKWVNTVRGILRGFGYRVGRCTAKTFHKRVAEMELPAELAEVVAALLRQLEALNAEIDRCEEELEKAAKELPAVAHLRQIPGVGPIVSLYFVLTIDDPERFRRSRDIAGYLGLRPAMRSSAGTSHYGRITKEGDPEMRRLLIQAANGLMRTRTPCQLQFWAAEIEARRGRNKAMVALARKLAVLMHHLWVTGEVFERFPDNKAA